MALIQVVEIPKIICENWDSRCFIAWMPFMSYRTLSNTLQGQLQLHSCYIWCKQVKGYGDGNMRLRSTFSLQHGHVCFLPTMHQPRIQNSWNLNQFDVKSASQMENTTDNISKALCFFIHFTVISLMFVLVSLSLIIISSSLTWAISITVSLYNLININP